MEERIEKIKSGAHWSVNIRPTSFEKQRIKKLSDVRRIVEECRVSLRGWDYPWVDPDETCNGNDWVQSGCDWEDIVEYWRFYQSAQFIHYFSSKEDQDPEAKERARPFHGVVKLPEEPSGYLSILSTLFRFTEIYEFAMRLVQKGVLEPAVYISIRLGGIKNRQLFFWESGRLLRGPYISRISQIDISPKTLPVDELLARGHEIALEDCIYLFERFNWDEPPRQIFLEEQRKFLERKL